MSRGSTNHYRVPYLHEKQIEREAQLLLDEWAESGRTVTAPVPVNEIVDDHLRLSLDFDDLRGHFGGQDVLGALWFDDPKIRVDLSLDYVANPSMRGRYNFTVGHEVGHWRLHREHFRNDLNQQMLFTEKGSPAFVCRDGDSAPEEWQANYFAGCLLMPRNLVYTAWQEWRGNDAAVGLADLEITAVVGDRERDERIAQERFCRPLAEKFEVSAQAMRIRLEKLALLVKEVHPGLL